MKRAAAACALALLVLGGQRARAELAERMIAIASPLEQLAGKSGDETVLELNGARLHVSTASVDADITAVLERFERLCDAHAPLLASQLQHDQGRGSGHVLQQNLGDAGVAVCVTQPRDAGLSELAQYASDYAQTGDLSVFGQLRYLTVRKTGAHASHVVLAHSSGALRLRDMFPERGDAAGADLPGISRPHGARRLLSARNLGGGSGMVAYTVQEAAGSLQRYVDQLRARGFVALPLPAAAGTERAAMFRGTTQLVVQSMKLNGETVIAAVALDSDSRMEKNSDVDE